ncbi:MAG: MGMT family protein [Nocardioidaceae bacterium]
MSTSPGGFASSTSSSTCGLPAGSAVRSWATCVRSGTGRPPATPSSPPRPENPTAVRAVGTACAKNPLPVVVPCHRVVRSDGQVGQYVGGVAAKRTLLALEAAG